MTSLTTRQTTEHLIVTLDESSDSERALPIALRFAERMGASTDLLAVVDSDARSATLRAHLADLARQSGPPVTSSDVVQGSDVAAEIGRRARSRPGSTIVMNSRGPSRASGVLTESLAAELLADGLPVVIVGPASVARAGDLPIVACLDGSIEAEQVLGFAAEWASASRVPLVLLIIAKPLLDVGPVSAKSALDALDPGLVLRHAAAKLQVGWPELDVRSHVISYPWNVADALSIYLDRHPAQLFAVATHLRSGWSRLIHPSATARIVHQLAAPVLVVPIDPTSTTEPHVSRPAGETTDTPLSPYRAGGPFSEIIVPIDPDHITPDSALSTIRALALAGHAEVLLLGCGDLTPSDTAPEPLMAELNEVLRPAATRWRSVGSGNVADATIAAAASSPASIVCVATEAHGQLIDAVTPTTTGQIVRWSPRTVVLVGPRCLPPAGGYRQVAACIDGSLISEAVAELTGSWAKAFGLPAFMLEVVESGTTVPAAVSIADRYVDRLSARIARRHGIPVTGETIGHAHASTAIRQWAEAHPDTLVVMASHGAGLSEHPLGGVVMDVVRHAPAAVVVIPAHPIDQWVGAPQPAPARFETEEMK